MHTGNAITKKRSCGRVPFLPLVSVACVILLTMMAPVLAQPAGCPTGMTGYWKFDEISGGPYDDFFGSNNATCSNCPTTVVGKLGNGLDFDGLNDGVDVTDDDSFDWNATSFTIEFWMRSSGCVCTTPVNGYTCNQVIVGRTNAPWWIGVNCETGNVGKLRCYFGNVDLYSNAFVNNDVWHHVVFQYDSSAGQYRLYIDGSLDNSVSAAGGNRAGTAPITLGYFSGAYRYYGLLDELALYNQALSLSDIQSHWNSGSGQSYCATNQAPVVTDIPDQAIVEGSTFTTITLDDFVSDVDNTDAEMTWTYSGNSQLTVSIVSRVATITIPNADWNGAETITFTATDPGSLSDSDPALFTVTAVNDAPVVTDIPDQTITEPASFATIPLDNFVSDADHADDQITWTAVYQSGSTDISVAVNPTTRVATISYTGDQPSGNTSAVFRFTAADPLAATGFNDATFTVNWVNDTPVVTDIPDQTIAEGSTFTTITLDNFVSDADNTDAQMTWTYSGNSALTVSIDAGRIATITIPNADWNGAETITFTATDPGLLNSSNPATFTVTAVNDAPVVTDILDQTIAEGGTFTTITLDDFVSDIDNTDAQMTWTFSGNTQLAVSIVNRIATITTPNADWNGAETITFTATDPGFLNSSDPASFTVTAVNDAPVVTDIPDQAIAEGSTFTTITLDNFVSDADNTDAQMIWTYSGNTELAVSIDAGRIATITIPNADWNGAETITFTATDPGSLSGSDPALFTVTAVNNAPVVTDIPDQTITEPASFATIRLGQFCLRRRPRRRPNHLDGSLSVGID